MTREQKQVIVAGLVETFRCYNCFYIVNAEGLTVSDTNIFRGLCVQHGVIYRVVKNTLIKKALQELGAVYASINEQVLKKFSGVLFVQDEGNVPAKLLLQFRNDNNLDIPQLKFASIIQEFFLGEDLDTLSKLKSKTELIGDVLALLQSPASRIIIAIQSSGHKIAGVVEQLARRTG